MRVETPSMQKIATFTQELPVTLSDPEMLDRGQRLAHLIRELELHEEKADFAKKELKKAEDKLNDEIKVLSESIHTHTELREIRCEGWLDFNRGVYEDIRTDTSDVLEGTQRKMTAEERQGELGIANTGHRGRRAPDIAVVKRGGASNRDGDAA